MKRILYIEDEPSLGKIVYETLQNQQYDVKHVADGAKVMEALKVFNPDICVVDIMLPNIDGYTLCKQIKAEFPNTPVIFLTAKTETSDLIRGFESGGTDYIKKPFSMEELIVRINNQLNISHKSLTNNNSIISQKIGTYTYLSNRYELLTPTTTIKLSQREQEILSILVDNINKPIDRKDILLKIWGDDSYFNSRNLDVYIRKIRGYFTEDSSIEIVTLKGKGYLFLIR
jgi:DNA-binding response OmpR family regulator